MNDSVTKLPLAMRFYLIGLIYRNSRMSCVCLASLVEVASDRQNPRFVFGVSIFETAVGMVCNGFGERRLLDH